MNNESRTIKTTHKISWAFTIIKYFKQKKTILNVLRHQYRDVTFRISFNIKHTTIFTVLIYIH